jgi:hypothetical protein
MCKVHSTKLLTKYEKKFVSKFVSFNQCVDTADKTFIREYLHFAKNSKWS